MNNVVSSHRSWILGLSSVPLCLAAFVTARAGQGSPTTEGSKLFANQCAPCHGAKGQGGPGLKRPLIGDKSAPDLAAYISKAMPPGPKHATPADAKKIAAHMVAAFYSPIAQERIRPPRVSLARLTVRQFQNAVSDLMGNSATVVPGGEPRGLKAEYFADREVWDVKKRVIDRVDPEIKFDFGTAAPAPQGFDPKVFSAKWQGSILAPDTGNYEFVVRSEHAVRLYVNGDRAPLVDAWVKSGNDTEYRASIDLLGGRAYPIRLEFSKATQGVNDPEREKKRPPTPASIQLLWKQPKRPLEVIPARCLYPDWSPDRYVVATPFPADDRSMGYERGNAVSKAWDEATTAAALEAADFASRRIAQVTGVPDNAPDWMPRLKQWAEQFLERAFRRPLDAEARATYLDKSFAGTPSAESVVKRTVILALKSPRFLYREIGGVQDGYGIAAQLSFGLWDTLPDNELRSQVGNLKTTEARQRQATRMANDPRAWNKLRDFFLSWLRVDEVPDIVKNSKRYPGFDATAVSDLRTSLELFIRANAWENGADYRKVMLSDQQFLNGRLGKLYGVSLPENASFQPVSLDAGQRVGLVTHPYLLARLAYLDGSSPIHRGVLVARNMLGRTLNPPPAAFAPLAASLHPSLTTRQRVALQTKPPTCDSCHSMINPLGFTLEKFDAIGRLRKADNGKPVDATGSYKTRKGELVKFAGAKDLARFLAESDEAQTAFVEKLFHHLVKQPVRAYGPTTLTKLESDFTKDQYNIRELIKDAVLTTIPSTPVTQ